MKYMVSGSVFLLAATLLGQQAGKQTPTPVSTAKSSPPASPNAQLEKQIADLQKQVKDLEGRFNFMQNYTVEHLSALEHTSATFDPTSPGPYVQVDSPVGPLLISLGKVEQYLDGYSVQLEVGNVSAASLIGFKITAKWAKRYKAGDGDYFDWYKNRKTKDFSFTGTLLSGRWNTFQLILPDTKPSEFGYLDVSVETSTVSMSKSPVSQ